MKEALSYLYVVGALAWAILALHHPAPQCNGHRPHVLCHAALAGVVAVGWPFLTVLLFTEPPRAVQA